MKLQFCFYILFFSAIVTAQNRFDVSSGSEFSAAQQQAIYGDTIVWESGVYSNTRMDINKDGLIITAASDGTVLFKGVSRAVINASDITFSGFQYIGGFIGNLDVIRVFGSDVLITQINIQNYTCHKYLVVDEVSRRTTISYCNFENRLNLDDKNILSILVDNEPGYHKIQYCSFKNFDGFGNDQGIEPIRIGVSTQGHLDSRTLVEYCYFTQCNGDGEIISHKSRQNVYRYNTFEDNPYSELVLRHGDEGIIYGNFFLNNMGGVRIREGSNHFVYNNYFQDIDRRAIFLMNDSVDPLSDIHIYHNTILNSKEIILGGNGSNPPTNVTIANNVFANPIEQLFDDASENETWIGNFYFGNLGINIPSNGLTDSDPNLSENTEGFFQPDSNSSIIASASDGYPPVPLYAEMNYDNQILLDLMQESRPQSISDRAIGASEFSSLKTVQPHATETNSGPSYLFDNLVDYVAVNASQLYISKEGDTKAVMISSNLDWEIINNSDWISTDLLMGTGDSQLIITIDANQESLNRSDTLTISGGMEWVKISVSQDAEDPVNIIESFENQLILFPNPTDGAIKLNNIPSGVSRSQIEVSQLNGTRIFFKEYQIENNELAIDVKDLISGTYLLNMRFVNNNGTIHTDLTTKFIRK